MFKDLTAHLTNRRNYEVFVTTSLGIALLLTLVNFWGIDIWRHDSLYYVASYDDKLSQEGRWINYFLFDYLRLVHGQLAVWLCYTGIAYFAYRVAFGYTGEPLFSLLFALLICQIPILPAQLQWPETLLPAFLLLGVAPVLARYLPAYIFFPLAAVLFFGTFSAFYFLLPLLFLKEANPKQIFLYLTMWTLAFLFAYGVTNLIVWLLTGDKIQIALWRNPHYVNDWPDLVENLWRIYQAMTSQFARITTFLFIGLTISVLLFGIYSAVVLRNYRVVLIGITCAMGVYFSTLPIGIYIQERTLTPVFVGFCVAFLLRQYRSDKSLLLALGLIWLVGLRMAVLSNDVITWYKANINNLESEFSHVLPQDPTSVQRLFVVAEIKETVIVFPKFNREHGYRGRFSEGFISPIYWLPVLRQMGYQHFRACVDFEGWDCDFIRPYYALRSQHQTKQGMFIAWKINEHDVILTLNPRYVEADGIVDSGIK